MQVKYMFYEFVWHLFEVHLIQFGSTFDKHVEIHLN
jgi:hypothetical protein